MRQQYICVKVYLYLYTFTVVWYIYNMSKPVYFRRKISDIEAGAYYTAAEVLLIGLRHIKEHDMSHPINTSTEEWHDIIDELIWFLDSTMNKMTIQDQEKERYKKASVLLGQYFADIWC